MNVCHGCFFAHLALSQNTGSRQLWFKRQRRQ
jgi:hypothetical protein